MKEVLADSDLSAVMVFSLCDVSRWLVDHLLIKQRKHGPRNDTNIAGKYWPLINYREIEAVRDLHLIVVRITDYHSEYISTHRHLRQS